MQSESQAEKKVVLGGAGPLCFVHMMLLGFVRADIHLEGKTILKEKGEC